MDKNKDWIDAKELHKSLKIKKQFSTWIKKEVVSDQFYTENEDYIFDKNYKISPEFADILTIKEKQSKFFLNKSGVYVLYCEGYCKVGITNNINKRIKTLQTGNPFLIQLVLFNIVNNAADLEKKLHKKYKHKNIRNEWFYLDNDDIQYIKNKLEA
jgi:hypothetical protein